MSRIAVNVCDLSEAFPTLGLGGMLLAGFVRRDVSWEIIYPDKSRVDTGSVMLNGPAADDTERLEALIELLQTVIAPRKVRSKKIRIYREGPRGGWKEIRSRGGK